MLYVVYVLYEGQSLLYTCATGCKRNFRPYTVFNVHHHAAVDALTLCLVNPNCTTHEAPNYSLCLIHWKTLGRMFLNKFVSMICVNTFM